MRRFVIIMTALAVGSLALSIRAQAQTKESQGKIEPAKPSAVEERKHCSPFPECEHPKDPPARPAAGAAPAPVDPCADAKNDRRKLADCRNKTTPSKPATSKMVTICKETVPSPDPTGTHFPFTWANQTNPPPGFSLNNGNCKTVNATNMDNHHKITEVVQAGWQVTQITCGKGATSVQFTGANSNSAFQLGDNIVDMDVNSDVTCTFTNKRTASPTGALQVNKRVINTLGVPTPATFTVSYTCTPSGPSNPSVPIAVGPNGVTVQGIAPNSQCKVIEPALPAIPNVKACNGGSASWVATYAPSNIVSIAANAIGNVVVVNTLTCDPAGSLNISKSVINALGLPTPSTVGMSYACTPSGPSNPSIPIPVGGNGVTVQGIAANSQCTVTEPTLSPIAGVKACNGGSAKWVANYSPSKTVNVPATGTANVHVTNTATCCSLDLSTGVAAWTWSYLQTNNAPAHVTTPFSAWAQHDPAGGPLPSGTSWVQPSSSGGPSEEAYGHFIYSLTFTAPICALDSNGNITVHGWFAETIKPR